MEIHEGQNGLNLCLGTIDRIETGEKLSLLFWERCQDKLLSSVSAVKFLCGHPSVKPQMECMVQIPLRYKSKHKYES